MYNRRCDRENRDSHRYSQSNTMAFSTDESVDHVWDTAGMEFYV
jgi:hypothetical protein